MKQKDFETAFWRDTKNAIPAISSDAPRQSIFSRGDSWLFISYLNDPWLNIGYASAREDLILHSLEASKAEVPCVVYGHSSLPDSDLETGRYLRSSTMQFHRYGIDKPKGWDIRLEGVEIRKAGNLKELGESNRIQVETFGIDPQLMDLVAGPKLLADPRVGVYNLLKDGRGISTLTIFRGEIGGHLFAELWSMATLPVEQGKGYGSHLLGQLMTDLSVSGDYGMALMASPEGKRLYDRLGFIDVTQTPIYQINGTSPE